MSRKFPRYPITIPGLKPTKLLGILLTGLLGWPAVAGAQSVIIPPPSFPVTPPAVQDNETNNEMMVFSPEENAPVSTQKTPPFQYGIFNLRPHVYYRLLYAKGILINTNQPENTVINQLSPGILVEIGRQWTLDYTPVLSFYSNNSFRDTLDQIVTLTGQANYEDWTFGLSQGFTSTSDPTVATATQTSQETFTTTINAAYQFNSKMSVVLGIDQNIIAADQFDSSSEWSTLDWLNYEFWPRLNAGIGAGLGYVNVETGSDMTYEQLQGQVNWRATDKISFQVHAGGEDRQFLDGGSDLLNLVFGAVVQYQPFEVTRVSINADRNVAPSYYVGQAVEETDFTGSLDQRLLGKFHLNLQGGYHFAKYVASIGAASPVSGREDDFYSFSVALTYPLAERSSIAAFFQTSNNSSTEPGFSYSSNQVGMQISYQF